MKEVLKVSELEINFILQATFYDLDDVLTYYIIDNSMTVTDSSLQHLLGKNPFRMTGEQLRLNFDMRDDSMRGMFLFNVLVMNSGQYLHYWSLVST
jgi:hypothetical protein